MRLASLSFRAVLTTIALLTLATVAPVNAGETAYEPMKPFAALVDKVWRGVGADPSGKPIVDVSRWEYILDGRAVQHTHRIDGGTYGGRTIFFYDEGSKTYVFHYFTTGGFHTEGTMTIEDGKIVSLEEVKGHETIAAVRGTIMVADGTMTSSSEYQSKEDGSWSPGHSFAYEVAPSGTEVGY